MTTRSKSTLGIAVLAVAALFVLPAAAQLTTAPTVKAKSPRQQIDRFHGEVVNFTDVAITVRDPKNVYTVRTFQFSPALAKKLTGHYVPNSSRVTIKFVHMSDTAVALKGKILKQQ